MFDTILLTILHVTSSDLPPIKKSANMNTISILSIYLELHQNLSVNFENPTWFSAITVKIMPP